MNRLKCTIQSLLIGCLLMSNFTTQAQNLIKPELKWARGLSGNNGRIVPSSENMYIAKGEGQSVISACTFDGTVDFSTNSTPVELTTDLSAAYIWKCNDDGDLIWVKKIGLDNMSGIAGFPIFSFTSISVNENNGDIYITGFYADSTIDFDPGPGFQNLIPKYERFPGMSLPSYYILKLNAEGEFQWVKSIGYYNAGYIIGTMGNSSGENPLIYFTGFSSSFSSFGTTNPIPFVVESSTFSDSITVESGALGKAFLFCLDGDGNLKWLKAISKGGPNGLSTASIKTDQFDNIYLTGRFTGTVDVSPTPAVYNITGINDFYLIKYNKSGELQWVRQSETGTTVLGGEAIPSAVSPSIGMKLDGNNGIYLSVDFIGPMNFNKMLPYGGPATLINAVYKKSVASTTTALVKYNTSGNFEWVKQIGGTDTLNMTSYSKVSVSKDGKIYLTGRYNEQLDLDPDTTNFIIKGNSNNFIAQYDTAGIFQWGGELTKNIDDASGAFTMDILARNNGDVYVCGTWDGSVDFDPSDSTFVLTPAGQNGGGFVLKLNISAIDTTSNPDPEDSISVIHMRHLDIAATIAPNPTMGMLNLIISESLVNGIVTISNIAGQTVFTRNNLYGKNFNFDLNDLATGTYYLELREGMKKATYKLVKR